MKNVLIALFSILTCVSCSTDVKETESANQNIETAKAAPYHDIITRYQDSVNNAFSSGMNDIIPKEKLGSHNQIQFFSPSEDWVKPAKFAKIENGKAIQMATSTERIADYIEYGTLTFSHANSPYVLTLYQSKDYPEELFCPFKDLTNAVESYGAGRYLNFDLASLEKPIIDFNKCYNPYCAYNEKYSCPIPPSQNHLNVRIEAGVKKWH